MNLRDTKEILARIAAVDNRDLSETTALAWHEAIGHLDFSVAERALKLARQDIQIGWLEPRHIVGKSRDAIAELNREIQANENQGEDWIACDKPINFDEMVTFYTELYKVAPYDRYQKTGARTEGGQLIESHVTAQELDRRARASAEQVGWTVPEPRWN